MIKVQGKGAGLPLPPLPLHQDPRITVQLVNSAGQCWSAAFPAPALRSSSQTFKDKGADLF